MPSVDAHGLGAMRHSIPKEDPDAIIFAAPSFDSQENCAGVSVLRTIMQGCVSPFVLVLQDLTLHFVNSWLTWAAGRFRLTRQLLFLICVCASRAETYIENRRTNQEQKKRYR